MQVRFLRAADGNYRKNGEPSRGQPIGVVVGLSKEKIGVAYWSPKTHKEKFDKNFLIQLAAGRAALQSEVKVPKRQVCLAQHPNMTISLEDLVAEHVKIMQKELSKKE